MNTLRLARITVHLGSLLPLLWLSVVIILGGDEFGADPAKEIQHFLGFVALTLFIILFGLRLFVSLTQQLKFQILHRPLGLWAFFYLVLHLLSYFWLELGGETKLFLQEISERGYLLIGLGSLLAFLFTLLAVSPLGNKFGRVSWHLHKVSYVALVLAGIHYFLSTKGIELTAIIYNILIATFLLTLFYLRKTSKKRG